MTPSDLPIELEGIRYSICRPDEVAEMVRVLAATFSRHDPPAVAVGLSEQDFVTYLTIASATAGESRLTIIARDLASGRMAGALLTEDVAAPAVVALDEVSPRFGPIYDLFGELESAMHDVEPIGGGSTLHLYMLGVDEGFARRGIAQQLVEACLANGATLGYRTAVTEATNRVSQHIFAKLDFVARAEAPYASYRRDGVATFASIAEHGGIKSMLRPLVAEGAR